MACPRSLKFALNDNFLTLIRRKVRDSPQTEMNVVSSLQCVFFFNFFFCHKPAVVVLSLKLYLEVSISFLNKNFTQYSPLTQSLRLSATLAAQGAAYNISTFYQLQNNSLFWLKDLFSLGAYFGFSGNAYFVISSAIGQQMNMSPK